MKIHLEFFTHIRSGNGLIGESVDSRWKQACFIFFFNTGVWYNMIKWVRAFISIAYRINLKKDGRCKHS